MSRVIGIIAIKGGVGKTSCVAQLGSALADFGKKVLLIDANFSAPNLGFHLGLVNPKKTLHDALQGRTSIHKTIYTYNKNLHVIPGSLLNDKINPFLLKKQIAKLRDFYDIIIVDSSPNLNHEILATMVAADELLVVTNPDVPTLSCTMHAVKQALQKKIPITGLILNKVRNKNFELSLEEIEDSCGVPVVGYLPESVAVPESIAYTTPLPYHKPLHDVSIEMKKLAAALIQQDYKDPRFLSQLRKLFDKSVRKDEVNRELLKLGKPHW
ncbi:MAG: AAA family ATPase [Nanoarchaeota archaeon]